MKGKRKCRMRRKKIVAAKVVVSFFMLRFNDDVLAIETLQKDTALNQI